MVKNNKKWDSDESEDDIDAHNKMLLKYSKKYKTIDSYLNSLTNVQLKHICEMTEIIKTGNKSKLIENIKKENYKLEELDNMIAWYEFVNIMNMDELIVICRMINISPGRTKNGAKEKIFNKNLHFYDFIRQINMSSDKKWIAICCDGHVLFTNKKLQTCDNKKCYCEIEYLCVNVFNDNDKYMQLNENFIILNEISILSLDKKSKITIVSEDDSDSDNDKPIKPNFT